MSYYRRLYEPGASYFFTVVTHMRRPFLTSPLARTCLRNSWRATKAHFPFVLDAVCLLPEHLHCIWRMPEDDDDFSKRWRHIKTNFTQEFLVSGGSEGPRSVSRIKRRERGIWHRRFWEHKIRNDDEYARLFDYIHFNPVKHGLVQSPEEWQWSTFRKYARMGWYEDRWGDENVPDRLKELNDTDLE